VNAAWAESPAPSVPVNSCVPFEVVGIVNVQRKLPFAPVTAEQAVPAAQVTAAGDAFAYPVPVKATDVPTSPEEGVAVN